MSLQKKTGSEVLKSEIFFIVHFSRQANGGVEPPTSPAYALAML